MKYLVLFTGIFIYLTTSVSAAHSANQEAGVQAEVDRLTAGILAGSLKRGQRNGHSTAATFTSLRDVAVDSKGNLFVVDDSQIRKITPDGRVSTFAGSTRGYADGPGAIAQFGNSMLGIAIDGNDTIYVADSQNRKIRKITPDGYVSTLAGSKSGYSNGWGMAAQFSLPRGIDVDSKGNVYVGDDKNNKIRKIAPNGNVTTLAPRVEFSQPRSIAVDGQDNVYVLDGIMIKKITPAGNALIMAENMIFDPGANKDYSTKFRGRAGMAADSDGNLYISSTKDKKVYKITPEGDKFIMAGMGPSDWIGQPNNITVGANGNIYLADDHNHLVHQITPAGGVGPLQGWEMPKSAQAPIAEPSTMKPEVAYKSAAAKKEEGDLFAATKTRAKKDPKAQFSLAEMYYEGRGVARNEKEAIKWYKKATKKIPEANYILGNIYTLQNNDSSAGKYYKNAAKKGHAVGQYEYGRRHYFGKVQYWRVVKNGDEAAADRDQIQKRYKNANEWNLKSAAQGYDKAQYALGLAYLRGEAIEIDNAKAIDYFTKAAEQGHVDAQFELAEIYRKGEITEKDYAVANDYYSKFTADGDVYVLAMQGAITRALDASAPINQVYADAGAQTALGLQYYRGDGVERDYAKAAELFDGAVMLGETDAQWMFARQYEMGKGVTQDYDQARMWYTIAAEFGHSQAQFRLGYLHHRGYGVRNNSAEAVYWYTKAAEQGNVNAQLSLGKMYTSGDGVAQDYTTSLSWYSMAAEQGDTEALYRTGSMYAFGLGADINDAKTAELYSKAAAQGHPSASKFTAIYEGAHAGDIYYQYKLAEMYVDGIEIREDYTKMYEWMIKAAEQGDAIAQYKLGMLYTLDLPGHPKELKNAAAWLTISADGGHDPAKIALTDVEKQMNKKENILINILVESLIEVIEGK